MASYLLNADDESMERWKECALRRNLSFAEWLRQAAEMLSAIPPSQALPPPAKSVQALPASYMLPSKMPRR